MKKISLCYSIFRRWILILLFAMVLFLFVNMFRIVKTGEEIRSVKEIKDVITVKKYIPLEFPEDAIVVEGKMRSGWNVSILVKVALRTDKLDHFINQPILKRNKMSSHTDLSAKDFDLIKNAKWDFKNLKFKKAFNGINLTPETNRSDGLWIVIQDSSPKAVVYIYYEG